MAKKEEELPFVCTLSEAEKNAIGMAIATKKLVDEFKLMPANDYRRRLGSAAKELGVDVSHLHQFILAVLPQKMGEMFGWDSCTISARVTHAPLPS